MSTSAGGSESCYSKDSGTTPSSLDEHGVESRLTKYDFAKPGLGQRGPDCGSNRVPHKNAVCPNGDAIRYKPILCRRVECPDCYQDWARDRVFTIALEIEARARKRDDRPHALAASITPEAARTMNAINEKLARRFYRRARRQSDIDGGYAVLHDSRIQDSKKTELRKLGYGSGGDRGGLWVGVREDALELNDWRKYVEWGPHLHNIGFPGRIEPHESDDFLIKKYGRLDELSDVVAHVRYLLSHGAVREGDAECRMTRPWGAFHHASDTWEGAKKELEEQEYHQLAAEVAGLLGMEWDADQEEMTYEDTSECPECGTPREEFMDLWDLPKAMDHEKRMGEPFASENDLDREARGLFEEIVEILHTANDPRIYDGDLEHPESVAKWVDKPPPEA